MLNAWGLEKNMNNKITEISVFHNVAENRFEVNLGEKKAVLIYMIKAGLLILEHTEVPPPFEGRGIAGKMAAATLEFAKKEGYKVRSYCSYTTRYLERHPEYGGLMG
jgi:predicted GNAT family acetyltransferase